ncbi:cytoskeleton protein RodZ [Dyella sp. OK004]|uniref:helix-turn-helix domain-containing protein n=1 Tax=Dyella sp. OK004 TaxID=1855292 RepID=UPI0008E04020|nr:helix-turn-helix domain-containing protein [Dyella sp. OK004]SFS13385.1 cytoskeleton protein RodZ [Dyella sp. OK004]
MTSKQSQPTGHDAGEIDLFDASAASAGNVTSLPENFGARLRAAREARGLDIESCGQALRLPVRVLRQLESGDYAGIDYQVYLAGYLAKYGRHVGVDEAAIQAEVGHLKPSQPTLVATGGISHSRYLLERYARAATYVVLTAAIVVPTIWLGVRGTLDRDVSHLAPLDAAPVAQTETAPAVAGSTGATAQALAANPSAPPAKPTVSTADQDQQPLLASMAPFPSLGNSDNAPPKDNTKPESIGEGAHTLVLSLPSASWVEVTTQDGSRLEYGLLQAGISKTYRSDKPLVVRIGNAAGAQVMLDGQPIALDGFRRANVAHFKVELRDGKATPAGV